MPRSPYVIALGLLLCSACARGEIFKCTDANGAVQFTDHPCGGDSTVITKKTAPPAEAQTPDEHLQKTQRLLDALQAEREQAKHDQEQRKAETEKRKHNCINARDDLRNITEAGRLYRLDEQGNRVILSDPERTRATDEARGQVAQWCD
jgi:uncharacterized protein DUF4124